MPFYKQSNGTGRSGPGISGDGFDGAEQFFEQAKNLVDGMNLPFMPSVAEQSASARAAAEAYLAARNGTVTAYAPESLEQIHSVPGEFPKIEFAGSAGSELEGMSKAADLSSFVSDFVKGMGDALSQMINMPLGIVGGIIAFFIKLFTDIVSQIGQTLQELARAASALAEETWKKQMQVSTQSGLLPLELQVQQASTQTLWHALKNSST